MDIENNEHSIYDYGPPHYSCTMYCIALYTAFFVITDLQVLQH